MRLCEFEIWLYIDVKNRQNWLIGVISLIQKFIFFFCFNFIADIKLCVVPEQHRYLQCSSRSPPTALGCSAKFEYNLSRNRDYHCNCTLSNNWYVQLYKSDKKNIIFSDLPNLTDDTCDLLLLEMWILPEKCFSKFTLTAGLIFFTILPT